MKILGIETSCDETAAAVVEDGRRILSSVVASSKELQDKTGGVIPEIAAREQLKCIIPVIDEAMQNAKRPGKTSAKFNGAGKMQNLDAFAVTVGPGLIGSLLVGVETAKTLSYLYKKPIIPINHIFAHLYANWLYLHGRSLSHHLPRMPSFPAIGLVVSGGHTELFLLKSHTDWKWIGGTLDDAAGEAFDKTARLLGLGYPGGQEIAACAAQYQKSIRQMADKNKKFKITLPRPMMGSGDFNFSFSGLKTAVIREVKKLKEMQEWTNARMQELAYETQESITDVLVKKTIDAAKKYQVKSILLGGGVAANLRLREKLESGIKNQELRIVLYVPPPYLCTDNASYIASYAYFHNKPIPWKDIQARPDLSVEV